MLVALYTLGKKQCRSFIIAKGMHPEPNLGHFSRHSKTTFARSVHVAYGGQNKESTDTALAPLSGEVCVAKLAVLGVTTQGQQEIRFVMIQKLCISDTSWSCIALMLPIQFQTCSIKRGNTE